MKNQIVIGHVIVKRNGERKMNENEWKKNEWKRLNNIKYLCFCGILLKAGSTSLELQFLFECVYLMMYEW